MDVETAAAAAGGGRFRTRLATLVGTTAIVAAVLAALHASFSERADRAVQATARLSGEVGEVLAVRGVVTSLLAVQELARSNLGSQGVGREIAGSGGSPVDVLAGQAEQAAAIRIGEIRLRPEENEVGILDPHTAEVLTAEDADIDALVAAQNQQAQLARQFGDRSDRTFLALSLLAVSVVFLGSAGIVGEGRVGLISLAAAGIVVLVAVAWAISAFLI
jgi:hypothetical protein